MLETLARTIPDQIATAAAPLPDLYDPAFGETFDRTGAVTPLPGEQWPGEDDTYPFGL